MEDWTVESASETLMNPFAPDEAVDSAIEFMEKDIVANSLPGIEEFMSYIKTMFFEEPDSEPFQNAHENILRMVSEAADNQELLEQMEMMLSAAVVAQLI